MPVEGFVVCKMDCLSRSGVGVHLALATRSGRDVNETASVLLALVGAALGGLGRLLGLDLGGLRLDLAGTRQTAVNLAHDGCCCGVCF